MRIAIISDIHAVASAFEAALDSAAREGYDLLVILGDLLTYGTEPERTLDLAQEALASGSAVLVSGNHDELYFELKERQDGYYATLPDWIRESAEWNWRQLDGRDIRAELPWQEELTVEGLLLAHANPFGHGDWTYLNSLERFGQAAAALTGRGLRSGVFGHTHRFRTFAADDGAFVATVGSVGQPREAGLPVSQWAVAELSPAGMSVSPRSLAFDWGEHQRSIQATTLSQQTKDRLCAFYK